MIELLKELLYQFQTIVQESYLELNKTQDLKDTSFPYLIYSPSSEHLSRNVEGFYVDVDIYDYSSSYLNLFEIEQEVKTHFKDLRVMKPDFYARFEYLRSSTLNSGKKDIKRRNLQFYVKVDWRRI